MTRLRAALVTAVLVGVLVAPAAPSMSGAASTGDDRYATAAATSTASTPSPRADESVTSEPIEIETTVPPVDDQVTTTTVAGEPIPGETLPEATDPPPPAIPASVRSSEVGVGSITLALLVLSAIAIFATVLVRRSRHGSARPLEVARAGVAGAAGRGAAADTATLEFLVELGETLVDAGDAVSHVESTLRDLGKIHGIDELGVLVLPTAIVVSVPGLGEVQTEVGTAGGRSLRLDQIDDVIHLVNAAARGEVGAADGRAELARIRNSEAPYGPSLVLAGYVLTTVGLAMVLRGGGREMLLAAALGAGVGLYRRATDGLGRSARPFLPLLAAAAVSTVVFAMARHVDDLIVVPVLVAPIVTFLPGALLTTAVLELATGQMVSGSARLASGAMQLVLLALGIVAGAQLVGVPGGDLRATDAGSVAPVLPWLGVAVFALGVVWFNGAHRGTLRWILISMYAAFAGQVLGGLFFGSALSAFFGAAAMTPVALLAARQPSGPTPLVTFLPGFWILVPGALGLEGVTRVIGADYGSAGTTALTTTVISMVGISLGILLGLTLVARDPDRPWVDAHVVPPTR